MSKADNKELEEAINYFRKRMDICLENAEICDENDFDEEATCLRKEQILIETILKELERLQEENKQYKKANREKADKIIEITDLYMKSIPKDKIREKLEELEKEYKEALEENSTKAFILKCQIEILKELLEKK